MKLKIGDHILVTLMIMAFAAPFVKVHIIDALETPKVQNGTVESGSGSSKVENEKSLLSDPYYFGLFVVAEFFLIFSLLRLYAALVEYCSSEHKETKRNQNSKLPLIDPSVKRLESVVEMEEEETTL